MYVAAGDEIDVGGAWLSLVDVVRDDGSTTRLVYEWDINTAASVLESIPPAPRHWAALGAVILALGYVVAPAYSAFIRRLELDTFNVSVGLVAVVVTAVASWYGYTYLQGVQQQADAVLNPEPQVINTVLPDAVLHPTRCALFADRCQWDRDEDIFASLIERLPRSRDEELFPVHAGRLPHVAPLRRPIDGRGALAHRELHSDIGATGLAHAVHNRKTMPTNRRSPADDIQHTAHCSAADCSRGWALPFQSSPH